jgi:hypothetical protein
MMPSNGPRYPSNEYRRRGDAIYAKIKPQVAPGSLGKIVAIDIETGEYEIDAKQMAAADRLLERVPDAQIWYVRIGYRAVASFCGPIPRDDS